MDNIKIIKNILGEEIIATIVDADGDFLTLKDILGLGINEKGMLVLIPYQPYTDATTGFKLQWKHVLFTSNPVPDIANHYSEAVGKIALPPKPQIIPVGRKP